MKDLLKEEFKTSKEESKTSPSLKKTYKVNLNEFPSKILSIPKNHNTLILGDLHGNAFKLIYWLTAYGIWKLSEKNFGKLQEIYYTEKLTEKDLDSFTETIDKLESNKNLITSIDLLGDTLADRGRNDYFTLKIFEWIMKHKIKVNTTVSNHDLKAIYAYHEGLFPSNTSNPDPKFYCPESSRSLLALGDLVSAGLIKKEKVNKLFECYYLPTLRHFLLDINNKEIHIRSHGPVYIGFILNIIRTYKNKSKIKLSELQEVTDEVNKSFQEDICNKNLSFDKKDYFYCNRFCIGTYLDLLQHTDYYSNLDKKKLMLLIALRRDVSSSELNENKAFLENLGKEYYLKSTSGHIDHEINDECYFNLNDKVGNSDEATEGVISSITMHSNANSVNQKANPKQTDVFISLQQNTLNQEKVVRPELTRSVSFSDVTQFFPPHKENPFSITIKDAMKIKNLVRPHRSATI